jgi:hypothetical protein
MMRVVMKRMKKLKVDGLGKEDLDQLPLSPSFILPSFSAACRASASSQGRPLLRRPGETKKERDRKEREKRKWRVWLGSGFPTGCSHVISAPVLLGSAICLVALLCLALGRPGSAPIHQPHWEQLWSYGAPHYSSPLQTNLNTTNTVWWLCLALVQPGSTLIHSLPAGNDPAIMDLSFTPKHGHTWEQITS